MFSCFALAADSRYNRTRHNPGKEMMRRYPGAEMESRSTSHDTVANVKNQRIDDNEDELIVNDTSNRIYVLASTTNNLPTTVNCSTLNEILLTTLVFATCVTRDCCATFLRWMAPSLFGWLALRLTPLLLHDA